MRILMLGSDDLSGALRALGHEVLTCAPQEGADLRVGEHDPSWRSLERLLKQKGFSPQAILVTDCVGWRSLPTGVWDAPVPTAFWGIDSPLNRFWQFPYARLFDLACLDQRREAKDLARRHRGAVWLPVAVEPSLYEGRGRDVPRRGVCFVGVINERVRPKRSRILEKISKIAPLEIRGGRKDAWFPTRRAAELYRSYQVILNENLFPGVTTRPLEVMASGGALLSEAAPGDMDRFFTEGEHLLYFGPENLEQKLKLLLVDYKLCRRLGEQGREAVTRHHGFKQRAETLVRHLQEASRPGITRPGAGDALCWEGLALCLSGLRWPAKDGSRRIQRGLARLRSAAQDGAEPLQASRALGLMAAALGRHGEALAHLARSAELGGARERLAWGLAAHQAGRAALGREVLKPLARRWPALAGTPGEAAFHFDAARLLLATGCDLEPGFNRRPLAPVLWCALEHLLECTRVDSRQAPAWELMGDLLLARGAPNQAYESYQRARDIQERPELAAKQERAGRQGYIL